MASHYEAPIRRPLVTGNKSYHDVTVDVAAPVEGKANRSWWIVFGISLVAFLWGVGCIIYTISTGLTIGSRASIFAASGCTAGIIPHICASVFGLAAILHTSAVAFQILKYVGVVYLIYLAWSMWRESGAIEFNAAGADIPSSRIAIRGFLINILNPKLSIFFLAFLPQFITPSSQSVIVQMLTLSSMFMLLSFLFFVGYGLLADQVRTLVLRSPAVLRTTQKAFAGLFVALGLKLAFTDR